MRQPMHAVHMPRRPLARAGHLWTAELRLSKPPPPLPPQVYPRSPFNAACRVGDQLQHMARGRQEAAEAQGAAAACCADPLLLRCLPASAVLRVCYLRNDQQARHEQCTPRVPESVSSGHGMSAGAPLGMSSVQPKQVTQGAALVGMERTESSRLDRKHMNTPLCSSS